MNRTLTYGFLAGLVVAASVADLAGGVPWRPAPRPRPAPVPPAAPPAARVHRTQYPEFPPAGVITARGLVAEEADPRPLVWVVDGAGDLRGCSNALSHANMLAGNPVELAVFPWSHGYRQLLKDQIDMGHARAQGARLAPKILDRQRREPGRRVVLVAHSAGCAVALSAAEALPPDSVDRLILLAPSVSAEYDVRPALGAAREGVDVFCSKKDWVALGFVTRVVGTTDRAWAPAAGRHGFQQAAALPGPEADRLRQHFWSADLAWTGHTGGHHGMHAPAFVHTYIFPLVGARVQP